MSDTLRIYDISVGDYRDATQYDIDRLVAVEQAYCRLRMQVEGVHVGLQKLVDDIRSRAGLPHGEDAVPQPKRQEVED